MQMAVFPEQQQSIQDQLMEISQTVPVKSTISLDNNNTFCMESSSFQIQALNVADTKDWHKSITRDHRSFLLQKLLQTQSPIPNPSDRRIQNLIVHIKRVESKMFEVANSKSEYYQLWVKRVDRLRQGLEERRSKRNEQRDQQAENHVCSLNNIIQYLNHWTKNQFPLLIASTTTSSTSTFIRKNVQWLSAAITTGKCVEETETMPTIVAVAFPCLCM